MNRRFEHKKVLVTGAAQGIGFSVASRCAIEGAQVVLADVNATRMEGAATELRDQGWDVVGECVDVASPSSMDALSKKLGPLDVVVANAGIQAFAPAESLQQESWARTFSVNAQGTFLTLQLASSQLVDRGTAVVISSIQAGLPNPMSSDYAASKAAALSTMRSFAAALATRGIRVNAVAPGRIDTALAELANEELGKLTQKDPQEMLAARLKSNPLGRMGTADEVAAAVAFLASDESSYITGTTLDVCGGDVMR